MIELFGFPGSNACVSARLALDAAGIEYEQRMLPPGIHPMLLRARGFAGPTVPALRSDTDRIQGSRAIARWAATQAPDMGLLPTDIALRERVLEVERRGEQLQNTIRRLVYVYARQDPSVVRSIVDASYTRAPRLVRSAITAALVPAAMLGHRIRSTRLDAYLDRLVELVDVFDAAARDGIIGGTRPNVADLQIGPNLAVLALDPDVEAVLRERSCWRAAQVTCERYPLDAAVRFPANWDLARRLQPLTSPASG